MTHHSDDNRVITPQRPIKAPQGHEQASKAPTDGQGAGARRLDLRYPRILVYRGSGKWRAHWREHDGRGERPLFDSWDTLTAAHTKATGLVAYEWASETP